LGLVEGLMTDWREKACEVLQGVLEGRPLQLGAEAAREEDSAFLTMLVLTALRKMVFLQKILKTLVVKKLSKQSSCVRAVLVLGAVELLFMQTPDYAVINSYVGIVKKKANRYVGGFVNAVLRKISQQKQEFLKAEKGEFFSQSFRTMLKKSYSAKQIDEIEKTVLMQPALDISCKDDESALRLAKAVGGQILPLGTVRLMTKGRVEMLPDFEKGCWWVQDFSSALPVKMLDNVDGKKVLELCAAPGGKTAQLLTKGAKVTCLDVSEERLSVLQENMARLGLRPEKVVCQDGIEFLEKCDEKFDVVVLDAPCSATGTLRRHPEVVFLKSQKDVERAVALQKKFLDRVAKVLNKGGVLLYCTCSLSKDEGEVQIKEFLHKNSDFKVVDWAKNIPTDLASVVTEDGFLRVLPQYLAKFGGADGFFAACLQKG